MSYHTAQVSKPQKQLQGVIGSQLHGLSTPSPHTRKTHKIFMRYFLHIYGQDNNEVNFLLSVLPHISLFFSVIVSLVVIAKHEFNGNLSFCHILLDEKTHFLIVAGSAFHQIYLGPLLANIVNALPANSRKLVFS